MVFFFAFVVVCCSFFKFKSFNFSTDVHRSAVNFVLRLVAYCTENNDNDDDDDNSTLYKSWTKKKSKKAKQEKWEREKTTTTSGTRRRKISKWNIHVWFPSTSNTHHENTTYKNITWYTSWHLRVNNKSGMDPSVFCPHEKLEFMLEIHVCFGWCCWLSMWGP